MHRTLIALLVLVAAAVTEVYLLLRIVSHPASSGASDPSAVQSLLGWAAVPLVGAVIVIVVCQHRALAAPLAMVSIVSVVGPLLGLVALAQYGHATPGFMVIAFVVQCVAVLWSCLGLRPNAT